MAVAPGQLAAILRGIGAPVTQANMQAFSAWQRAEGGNASFNPFNTTQGAAGATSYNSNGGDPVKNYRNAAQGTQATIQTLKNGHYQAILKALQAGKNPMAVAAAVGSSPWGTSASLMESVLRGMGNNQAVPSSAGGGFGGSGKSVVKIPGGKGGTHMAFDAATFHKQAAMIMLNQASERAHGTLGQVDPATGQPAPDLMTQLLAARKAATVKVSTGINQQAGPPGAGGGLVGSGKGSMAVKLAAKQIGLPYVWGGEKAGKGGGFDCSGLVQYVYGQMGIKLPRVAVDQGRSGRAVSYAGMKPGDLLVENNGDHVVIYAGGGKVIEAPHTGDHVKYAPLSWFPGSQYHARRIVG